MRIADAMEGTHLLEVVTPGWPTEEGGELFEAVRACDGQVVAQLYTTLQVRRLEQGTFTCPDCLAALRARLKVAA